jgi:hypothetical protein
MQHARTILTALLFALAATTGAAQPLYKGNQHVAVRVNEVTGQFYIDDTRGPKHLMYPDWTSHTNFKMIVSGATRITTNDGNSAIPVYTNAAHTQQALYVPPNHVIYRNDTIATVWDSLYGFHIEQLTYPFLTFSSGLIAIEYRVTNVDAASGNQFLGVLLEMDLFVDDPRGICPNTGNDRALVLSSHGYEASPRSGTQGCWNGVCADYSGESIPEWFHAAGLFPNIGSTVAIGRFWGPSVVAPYTTGPVLTKPDEVAFGDWGNNNTKTGLKDIGWDIFPLDLTPGAAYMDAAAIVKWNAVGDKWRCCMSYGPDDVANQNQMCQGSGTFTDLEYPRVTQLDTTSGFLFPDVDTLRVWCANMKWDSSVASNVKCTIDTSRSNIHLVSGQAIAKPMNQIGGPASNNINAGRSGYCEFYYQLVPRQVGGSYVASTDSFRVTISMNGVSDLLQSCEQYAHITIGKCSPNGSDARPPQFTSSDDGAGTTTVIVTDNEPTDTGIDSIMIMSSVNMAVAITRFTHCTSQAVPVTCSVIDQSLTASFTLRAVDCAGNPSAFTRSFPSTIPSHDTVLVTTHERGTGSSSDTIWPFIRTTESCGGWTCSAIDPYANATGIDTILLGAASTNALLTIPSWAPRADTAVFIVGARNWSEDALAYVEVIDGAGNSASYKFVHFAEQPRIGFDSLQLVPVASGDTTADTTISIINSGSDPVTVTALALRGVGAGAFALQDQPAAPFIIAVGDTARVGIRWTGSSGDTLHCDDADLIISTCTSYPILALTGCTKAPAAHAGDWNSPLTRVGASSEGAVLVTSIGTTPVQVTGAAIRGADSADFSIDFERSSPFARDPASSPWVIASGMYESITCVFSPTSRGVKHAQLELDAGALGIIRAVLSGEGTDGSGVGSGATPGAAPAMMLFPIPASDAVTATLRGVGVESGTRVRITIEDLLGRTVYQQHATLDAAARARIDLSSLALPSGAWVVRVVNGATVCSRMMMIERR